MEIHRALHTIQSIQGCLSRPGYSDGSLCSILRLRVFILERRTSRPRGGGWWRGPPLTWLYLGQYEDSETTHTILKKGTNTGTPPCPTDTPPPSRRRNPLRQLGKRGLLLLEDQDLIRILWCVEHLYGCISAISPSEARNAVRSLLRALPKHPF